MKRLACAGVAGAFAAFTLMEVAWSAVLLLHFGPPLPIMNVLAVLALGVATGIWTGLYSLIGGGKE